MELINQSIKFDETCDFYKLVGGYLNCNNDDLARYLERLNLLEEGNRKNPKYIYSYIKWSFSTSFLNMINAWQWFLSGILLSERGNLPAQVMQLYYYAIFFSSRAFLAAQFKGNFTVKTVQVDTTGKTLKESSGMYPSKQRKLIWIDEKGGEFFIGLKDVGGDEHAKTASWFYNVFNNWELKSWYPDVCSFSDDPRFHVYSRNMYTYSLADIAEELFETPDWILSDTNKVLVGLWNRDVETVNYFPEEFWALEYLKVVTDIHFKLMHLEVGKRIPDAQRILLRGFQRHNKRHSFYNFLEGVFNPVFKFI